MALGVQASRSLADIPVFRATHLPAAAARGSWQLDNLIGILAEISDEAPAGALSFATEIVNEAQSQNEPVAWVAAADSIFFPPDLLSRGVDLGAVAVIRVHGETDALTASEWLLRSGAFGLVIVDLGGQGNVSDAALGRILKLAERTQCAVLFLTRKRRDEPSLGSRISLRGCIVRPAGGSLSIDIHTVKDKRSNSSSRLCRHYDGPPGMY